MFSVQFPILTYVLTRRSNYGNDRVETVFFVGLPSGVARLGTQAEVEAESHQFKDIVQISVIDSYR